MTTELKEILTDAVRYLELRRIWYNLALILVCLGTQFLLPEQYREELNFSTFSVVVILAVIANILYCAAYIPDVVVQFTTFRALWRKIRIGLFILGTLFASLLTYLVCSPVVFD